VTIVARDTQFTTDQVILPAHTQVSLTFDNQDAGISHNVAARAAGIGVIFATPIRAGPATDTVSFTTPAAGSYSFICDVHPLQMRGTLVVQ
jgi:plastocyanin